MQFFQDLQNADISNFVFEKHVVQGQCPPTLNLKKMFFFDKILKLIINISRTRTSVIKSPYCSVIFNFSLHSIVLLS